MSRLNSQLVVDMAGIQQLMEENSSALGNCSLQIADSAQQQPSVPQLRDLLKAEFGQFQVSMQAELAKMLEPMRADLKKLMFGESATYNEETKIRASIKSESERSAAFRIQMQEQIKDLQASLSSQFKELNLNQKASSAKIDKAMELMDALPSSVGTDPKLFAMLEASSTELGRLISWTQRADDEFNRQSQQLVQARQNRDQILNILQGNVNKEKNDRVRYLEKQVVILEESIANAGVNLLRNLAEIERRGNVEIDEKSGEVKVLREIGFVGKKPGQDPVAEFKSETDAYKVLDDIAKVWSYFKVQMTVEGHTKGGENDFWQNLANNRAKLIVETLKTKGVDFDKMTPVGLPGKKGLNKVGVVINLDIFPDID